MVNLDKHTNTKSKPKPTSKFKNCSHVYASLCTIIIHNKAQNSAPSNLQTVIKAQTLSIGTEGRNQLSNACVCVKGQYFWLAASYGEWIQQWVSIVDWTRCRQVLQRSRITVQPFPNSTVCLPVLSFNQNVSFTVCRLWDGPAVARHPWPRCVLLDAELSMKQRINKVAATCLYQLRRLWQIRRCVGPETQLVLALVTTRLDYCYSVLAALPQCTVERLQHVQNVATHLIFNSGRKEHTPCHMCPVSFSYTGYQSGIKFSTNCVLWCITSGLKKLHAISVTSYSPLQLERYVLVCALPLQKPLHLSCIRL